MHLSIEKHINFLFNGTIKLMKGIPMEEELPQEELSEEELDEVAEDDDMEKEYDAYDEHSDDEVY
jgi:hypothetical protein